MVAVFLFSGVVTFVLLKVLERMKQLKISHVQEVIGYDTLNHDSNSQSDFGSALGRVFNK